MSHGETEF